MVRVALDGLEREIDEEVRKRFAGGAVKQVRLLQYGDDPEVEPGEVWVRVLVEADGPEDYERSMKAFGHAHEAAAEQLARDLSAKLREIRLLEFTCSDPNVTYGGHGPRMSMVVGQRLSDIQAWEQGENFHVLAQLGTAALETLDTLITAGIVASRGEAIRWSVARIRERPAYEQLQERVRDIGRLKDEF
jgi:hypothetical protein